MKKIPVKVSVRRDLRNQKLWVFTLTYGKRPYPNVVSGRFPSRKVASAYAIKYIEKPSLANAGYGGCLVKRK